MTEPPVRQTWEERELVLLKAIARFEQEAGEELNSWQLAELTGLEPRDVEVGLHALYDAGYITGTDASGFDQAFGLMAIRLEERGRRAVGQWPPEDQFDAFVAVLEQRIAEASTDEERSRLERVRDAALGVGRDVLTSVLSAWARQVGGL